MSTSSAAASEMQRINHKTIRREPIPISAAVMRSATSITITFSTASMVVTGDDVDGRDGEGDGAGALAAVAARRNIGASGFEDDDDEDEDDGADNDDDDDNDNDDVPVDVPICWFDAGFVPDCCV
jgi:hypothetical protein